MSRTIEVVAAVVRRGRTVLLARRREGSLRGHWEFPGGKVEAGETHPEALERELREELSVAARVGALLGESTHQGTNGSIRLFFYACELLAEPQQGYCHDGLEWVALDAWKSYRVAPADIGILQRLMDESTELA
ncbi:NUDIX domain-containing protein [bacterium]|nr:NUDIX domain-containing protein [bacterium]